MPNPVKRVFLSSTGRDLLAYREIVASAINSLDDFKVVRMEDFGALDWEADDFCRRKVEECDIYLGLIGHFYGSTPEGSDHSFTEREYDAAVGAGKPLLLFVARDDFPLPASLANEVSLNWNKTSAFRDRVRKKRIVDYFGSEPAAPEKLSSRVTKSLLQLQAELPVRAEKIVLPADDNLDEVERRYLGHIAERYRYLDFRGMGVSDRLPVRLKLLDIYVPLLASLEVSEGEAGKENPRVAGRELSKDEKNSIGRVGLPQQVLEIVKKEGGVILLGDPGAGKSTFIKYLALVLAEGRGAEIGMEGRIPFLVPLAAYASRLASGDLRLDHFVAESFAKRTGDLPINGVIARAMKSGRALFLLDGLDEVRDLGRQYTVVDRVRDFHSLNRVAGNKIVLTSRIVGYREVRAAAEGLEQATLIDFDSQEIEIFLDKWVQVQEEAALGSGLTAKESAKRERWELGEAIRKSSAVRALAANPLLLTILALMKRQGVSLPEQRSRLYDTYIRTLLEDWNRARSLSGRPVAEKSAMELLKTLTPIALWMHATSPGIGLVKQGDLEIQLDAIYLERSEPDPEGCRTAFLHDLSECSLLIERGNGQYGFVHLTFLEYLAACELAKQEQLGLEQFLAKLLPHFGVPAWREILLLAIGYIGVVQGREIAAEKILLYFIETQPGLSGEAVIFAGDALADLGPSGVSRGVHQRVCSALLSTLQSDGHAPAVRRALAGRTLARLGDPRPEALTLEGMRFCWVPPGPFIMGSPEEDREAWPDEKPSGVVNLLGGYWLGIYPITYSQFCMHLESTGVRSEEVSAFKRDSNWPVGNVSWLEATEFCSWLTECMQKKGLLHPGWRVLLPSEAEWEKAARGGLELADEIRIAGWADLPDLGPSSNRRNPDPAKTRPWGSRLEANRLNSADAGIRLPSAVGCFPGGRSPVGAEDLLGNVWEWTRSVWSSYPYDSGGSREDVNLVMRDGAVMRGGSCFREPALVRCAVRCGKVANFRDGHVGFRIAVLPSPAVVPV